MYARLIFAIVNFAARKGLATEDAGSAGKRSARVTGIRGETYAYWYLRRCGYTLIARNFTIPGIHGEIDIVGYDGRTLAFVEVKTRSAADPNLPAAEEAVNHDKRRNLARMAIQFIRARRLEPEAHRFDILAIETSPGARPITRLHKDAFGAVK